MRKSLLIILLPFLVAACSSIKIVPQQVEGGTINGADNSQTIVRNDLEIKARLADSGINAYNLEQTVSSFNVSIKNNSSNEVLFSDSSFVLTDERGLQYEQLTPERLKDILKKDSYYLMPYPYVGFYYLEDFQKTSFYNRFNSSLPYYYELYPQDLLSKSLPATSVIPGMSVEGLLFFKIDLANHQQVKLHVYRKNSSRSLPADFIFPFTVLK
ncbi:hypothetical protein [Pelotalea chapellei]|uniref:Lipoprotein n=1 Tax=Pelotalea chapellei TaxID=44671 RepID=A0ABS5U790_9BACT|nr:hypothetical protein [Pelotalea chapellei]MBT1071537.1 hypothetical protein [Pelotalea chapellei]